MIVQLYFMLQEILKHPPPPARGKQQGQECPKASISKQLGPHNKSAISVGISALGKDALPRLTLGALSWPRLRDKQGHKVPCNWLVPSNRKSCLRQEMMEIWSWPASSAVSRQKGTCTWVCTGTRPWSPETRDAERAVPACLGRDVGTAVGPTEDGMRLGRLGVQAHRLQGFQAVGMPWDLQKHRRNWLDSRAEGRAMCL